MMSFFLLSDECLWIGILDWEMLEPLEVVVRWDWADLKKEAACIGSSQFWFWPFISTLSLLRIFFSKCVETDSRKPREIKWRPREIAPISLELEYLNNWSLNEAFYWPFFVLFVEIPRNNAQLFDHGKRTHLIDFCNVHEKKHWTADLASIFSYLLLAMASSSESDVKSSS